jgi:hypothetical protein
MKINNYIGEGGKTILEYVPENDQDRDQIEQMQAAGEIPDEPAQNVPTE